MWGLVAVIVSSILLGMGYLCVNCPKIAVSIIRFTLLLATGLSILCFINIWGKGWAYNNSIKSTFIDIENVDSSSFKVRNKITLKNFDSINNEHNNYIEKVFLQKDEIYRKNKQLTDSIRNNIQTLSDKNEEVGLMIFYSYSFLFLVSIIFYYLSKTFDNEIRQKKSKEVKDKSDQKPT